MPPVFTAALFTIAKAWKQTKRPSTQEWIKRMWYICIKKYYPALKNNEVMPFATIWIDLAIIMSDISHSEKNKYHMISHIRGI